MLELSFQRLRRTVFAFLPNSLKIELEEVLEDWTLPLRGWRPDGQVRSLQGLLPSLVEQPAALVYWETVRRHGARADMPSPAASLFGRLALQLAFPDPGFRRAKSVCRPP